MARGAAGGPLGRHPAYAAGAGRLARALDLKLSLGGVSGIKGRVFLAILATVLAASAGLVAWTIHASSGAACSGFRWTVKTLQDGPNLLRPQETTIHFLTTRHAPSRLPTTRLPFERHVYTVSAAVVLVQPERDRDLHVLLRSGPDHMISEAPSPACDQHATPYRGRQMRVARNRVRLCAKARITGVAFFDFPHGQTGVAPNAIELHPILGFRCLASSGPVETPTSTETSDTPIGAANRVPQQRRGKTCAGRAIAGFSKVDSHPSAPVFRRRQGADGHATKTRAGVGRE
jgi:hypothetical protein